MKRATTCEPTNLRFPAMTLALLTTYNLPIFFGNAIFPSGKACRPWLRRKIADDDKKSVVQIEVRSVKALNLATKPITH